MPNAPHQDRTRHGYEAPTFIVRPCPNCGGTNLGSSSGPRPSTTHYTCSGCEHQWIADSEQAIAATLAMQGSQAA